MSPFDRERDTDGTDAAGASAQRSGPAGGSGRADGGGRAGEGGRGPARDDGEFGRCPQRVAEFADQAVVYVRAAVGTELDYGGDTLPVLDHYLRGVPVDRTEAVALVLATAGAYFGEVVRRTMGGRWELAGEPDRWRVILPSAIAVVPAGIVAAVIARSDDLAELDPGFDVPPVLMPYVEAALDRMGPVSLDEYYSLSGRFDTLEHLHAVIVAVAANASAAREPEAE